MLRATLLGLAIAAAQDPTAGLPRSGKTFECTARYREELNAAGGHLCWAADGTTAWGCPSDRRRLPTRPWCAASPARGIADEMARFDDMLERKTVTFGGAA